jgi:hypothetical protein
MFYVWHTVLIVSFIATAFVLGYNLGKRKEWKKRKKY